MSGGGNRSRYIKLRRGRLPRKPRSRQVWGAFEDTGVYMRCWNCNFIFNRDRDAQGGGGDDQGDGRQFTDAISVSEYGADPLGRIEIDNNPNQHMLDAVLIQEDGSGNPIEPLYTPRKVDVSGGCPFCGTRNLP